MGLAYQGEITARFREISREALKAAAENFDDQGLLKTIRSRSGTISAVFPENEINPPLVMPIEQGVFAHAPASLKITARGKRTIRLSFGLGPGSWEGEHATDGVCFQLRNPGEGAVLWRQCLHPAANPSDREIHSAMVDLPAGAGVLRLETECFQSCNSDWSYWSEILLQ